MTDQQAAGNGQAQAGAAGAVGGTPVPAPPAALGGPQFATEYVAPENGAHGVTFTSPHPEGGSYAPVPPLPAEEQHARGYQPLAAEHERRAVEACGGRQHMQGTDQPNIEEGTEA